MFGPVRGVAIVVVVAGCGWIDIDVLQPVPPATTPCTYAPLSGPILHVATTGDDATGDGSSNAPWRTISHAAEQALPGSNVVVAPGSYVGTGTLRRIVDPPIVVRA